MVYLFLTANITTELHDVVLYIFEFTPGVVMIQRLVTIPEKTYVYKMCLEPDAVGKALKLELFGMSNIDKLSPKTDVKLPLPEVKSIDA